MTSAPSWCWIRIETSGVNRCVDAVQVGGEGHPVVVDARQPGLAVGDHVVVGHPGGAHGQHLLEPDPERHHLEAAAVGERRTRPVHEGAQAAGRLDDVGTRLQVQVVGVGQHGLGAERGHALGQHGLDRGLGADRDERRRSDAAVRRADHSGPAQPPGQPGADREAEAGHARSSATATAPAVEVRSTPSLIDTGCAPAATKASSSSAAMPPSGPTTTNTSASAGGRWSASRLVGALVQDQGEVGLGDAPGDLGGGHRSRDLRDPEPPRLLGRLPGRGLPLGRDRSPRSPDQRTTDRDAAHGTIVVDPGLGQHLHRQLRPVALGEGLDRDDPAAAGGRSSASRRPRWSAPRGPTSRTGRVHRTPVHHRPPAAPRAESAGPPPHGGRRRRRG